MTNSNPSVEDEICQNFTSRTAKLDSHIKCNISLYADVNMLYR